MKCCNCKWFVPWPETKKNYNKAWDFKKFDGTCMHDPQEVLKYNDNFCNHFEEIKDDTDDKNK